MSIIKKFFQFLYKVIKKKSVVFLVILTIIYHSVFNTYVGGKILHSVFHSILLATIQFEVRQFSLFYGIELSSVSITPKDQTDAIFKTDRLALLYDLPKVFLGKLVINEVTLLNPSIYLKNEDGKWNFDKILQPSEPTPEEPTDTSTTESPIDTYLSIYLFARLNIESLSFTLEQIEKGSASFVSVKGITLRLLLESIRFSKIPLDRNLLSLFKQLSIELNPQKTVSVFYTDKTYKIEQDIAAKLLLYKKQVEGPLHFFSELELGSEEIQITVNQKLAKSFQLLASYSLEYFPQNDSLVLDHLKILFNKDVWLNFVGVASSITTASPTLSFESKQSKISLGPVFQVIESMPFGKGFSFGGSLSIDPLKINGTLDNLNLAGKVNAKNVFYASGKSVHRLDFLRLDLNAILDLNTDKKPTASSPLPILKMLDLSYLDLSYNSILLSVKGAIHDNRIGMEARLKNLILNQFTKAVYGGVECVLKVNGPDYSNLKATLEGNISKLRYSIGNSLSGLSSLKVSLGTELHFNQPFGLHKLEIPRVSLNVLNSENKPYLNIKLDRSSVVLSEPLTVKINTAIQTDLKNLSSVMPLSFRDTLSTVIPIVGNTSEVTGKVGYSSSKKTQNIHTDLTFKIPGLKIDDLNILSDVALHDDIHSTIEFPSVKIRGFKNNYQADIQGNLKKLKKKIPAPFSDYYPDIKVSVSLNAPKEVTLIENLKYKGMFSLVSHIKDNDVRTSVKSEDVDVSFRQGECKIVTDCMNYRLVGLNMDVPIHHDLSITNTETLIIGDVSKYTKNFNQTTPYNISIKKIFAPHPAKLHEDFEYIKEINGAPGLTLKAEYRANYLFIDQLRVYVLDGVLYGKDILFNLGSANLENIEYRATMQIKDIDLKQLLPEKSRKRFDDGKIKADINVSGRNLNDPIGNLELFFSVYQIGKDFGKSAINVISPQNLFTDWVIGSYSVDKLDVQLSKGLVYATILFKKSVLSTLIAKIEDNKITQERVPLANFLNRAKSEISTY